MRGCFDQYGSRTPSAPWPTIRTAYRIVPCFGSISLRQMSLDTASQPASRADGRTHSQRLVWGGGWTARGLLSFFLHPRPQTPGVAPASEPPCRADHPGWLLTRRPGSQSAGFRARTGRIPRFTSLAGRTYITECYAWGPYSRVLPK